MGNIRHSNNASTTLASGITAVATSITVAAGTGALFPTVGGALYAMLSIENDAGVLEIVKLTARAGDVLTVVRAQEGTSGFAFASGSRIENRLTAGAIDEFVQKNGDTMTGALAASAGTAALPSYTFAGDLDSGLFLGGANDVRLAIGGASKILFQAGVVEIVGVSFNINSGTAAAPGLAFDVDTDTGLWRSAADELSFTTGGVTRLSVASAFVNCSANLFVPGTIELGHASDTTLSRLSAGVPAVEGNALARINQTEAISGAWTFSTEVLGTAVNSATSSAFRAKSVTPAFRWEDTNAGADEKMWTFGADGTALSLVSNTDAGAVSQNIYRIIRSGLGASSHIWVTGTSGQDAMKVDNSAVAGQTRLLIWDVDNNTLERVTVGAADSGGAGFKLLRIPN